MDPIRYYSTNRYLEDGDHLPFREMVNFTEALFMGQAPDGGLFMPDRLPSFSPEEIADKLFISLSTVKTHRAHIMEKLDIHDMAGLTKIAIRKGLCED